MPLIAPHHKHPRSTDSQPETQEPNSNSNTDTDITTNSTTSPTTTSTPKTTTSTTTITTSSETTNNSIQNPPPQTKNQTHKRPTTLNFITSNAGKLRETRHVLLPNATENDNSNTIELLSRGDVEIDEIQGSIEEIARDKCKRAAFAVGGPVLTEDTALEFQALKGLPGPYIKYFLAALGHEGLNNLLAAYDDKTVFAVCTFAFCAGPGEEVILFQGRTEGKIVPARGAGNFGWDPCFEYEGKTYAEMDKDEKSAISHRGKALEKLKAWLGGAEPEA